MWFVYLILLLQPIANFSLGDIKKEPRKYLAKDKSAKEYFVANMGLRAGIGEKT